MVSYFKIKAKFFIWFSLARLSAETAGVFFYFISFSSSYFSYMFTALTETFLHINRALHYLLLAEK